MRKERKSRAPLTGLWIELANKGSGRIDQAVTHRWKQQTLPVSDGEESKGTTEQACTFWMWQSPLIGMTPFPCQVQLELSFPGWQESKKELRDPVHPHCCACTHHQFFSSKGNVFWVLAVVLGKFDRPLLPVCPTELQHNHVQKCALRKKEQQMHFFSAYVQ